MVKWDAQKGNATLWSGMEVVLGKSLLKIVLPPSHFKKYTPFWVVPLEELHFLSKLFHLTRLPPVFAKNKCGPHVRGHLEDLHILTHSSIFCEKSKCISWGGMEGVTNNSYFFFFLLPNILFNCKVQAFRAIIKGKKLVPK